jgi:hypothetical protein
MFRAVRAPIEDRQGEIELLTPLDRFHGTLRWHDLSAKPLQG